MGHKRVFKHYNTQNVSHIFSMYFKQEAVYIQVQTVRNHTFQD